MIKLTGINKIYRTNEIETVALENVNLEVNKGEFLSIMGPSGCGKSTLLNIMGLLDAPTSGTIEIAGTKVDGMKDKELAAFRNRKLGFVFQSFHLINSLKRAFIIRKLCIVNFISSTSFYLSFKESTIVRRAAIHAGSAALNRLMTTQKTNASRNTHGLNSASMFKLNSPDVPTF